MERWQRTRKDWRIRIWIASLALLLSLLMVLLWWLETRAKYHWTALKNSSELSTPMSTLGWNFWEHIWRSGEIMATRGNIGKLRGYQDDSLINLIAVLFGGTASKKTSDSIVSNFYSFNDYIQCSVFLIVLLGLTLLLILYLLYRILWNHSLHHWESMAPLRELRTITPLGSQTENLLEIRGLSFKHSPNSDYALREIDLTIKRGTLNIIIGPNGSGKTTLLKNLINLYSPSQGTILWNGMDLSQINKTQFARQISYIPQFLNLQNPISALDFLSFARYPYRQLEKNSPSLDRLLTLRALQRNKCLQFKDRHINELSGGQRQKIILTNVLVQETEVIVLDEPTSYLDMGNQKRFLEILSSFRAQGKTIIMILHDLVQSIAYADNLIVLREGRIYNSGDPRTIVDRNLLGEVFGIGCEIKEIGGRISLEKIHAL